jgi:uncharacterized membrane protein YfcA
MIDTAHLSPWLLLVAPVIIVIAYTVFGLSGFGSTLVSVPILAHFLPVSYLVPLMAVLDLASAIFIGTTGREHISKTEMKRIVPFMFVGFVIGATVLVGVPDQYLRAALGIFAATIGIYSILNPVVARSISHWWSIPAGIVAGASATVFGAGGPIYSAYLSGRRLGKNEARATVSALISISAFTRAVIYAVTGLVHLTTLAGAALLSPFVWLGLKLGHRIHLGLTQEQMRRAVGLLLVCTGASLLFRSVWAFMR